MLEIGTGIAAIALFDPECLKHRLNDDRDWFSLPDEELKELNAGNLLILELGEDGIYRLNRIDEEIAGGKHANLRVLSGKVYIGAAENISGGGLGPSESLGGRFLEVGSGSYTFAFRRSLHDRSTIEWNFWPSKSSENSFVLPVEL